MSKVHRSIFLRELKHSYPELGEKLNRQHGMLHLEVSVLLDFLQQHIDTGAREQTEMLMERVNRYYLNGNKALRECIRNGVCEDLTFTDANDTFRSWALAYLCAPLKKERQDWVSALFPR